MVSMRRKRTCWFMSVLLCATLCKHEIAAQQLVQSTAALSGGPRYVFNGASVGTMAIFAGGFNGGSASTVIDIFDGSSGQWLQNAFLSQARMELAIAVLGTKAIMAVNMLFCARLIIPVNRAVIRLTTSIRTVRQWSIFLMFRRCK